MILILLNTILLSTSCISATSIWNSETAKYIQNDICNNQPEHPLIELNLTGTIPAWLNGNYFRNGPGQFDTNNNTQQVNSVFDGYSQIHKFTIDGMKQIVTHMSKFVESARHITLKQRNDMSYQGKIMFGTTPTRTENYLNVFNLGGEVSVNLFQVGNENNLLAVGELPYGQEINPSTLETIQGTDKKGGKNGNFFKYNDSISEMGVGCAHALTLNNGDTFTRLAIIDMASMATHTDYQIVRIKKGTTTREVMATVKKLDSQITYSHSFAMVNSTLAVLPCKFSFE